MLRLTSRITIGDYQFTNCVEVEINSSWEDMTDRCSITIPRKVKWIDKDLSTGTNSVLSVGMPVLVELGYDFNYSTYFQGFITDIGSKTPVEIECQDAFWFLKQCSGSFTTSKGGTLEDAFTEIERIYRASAIYETHGVDITFTPVPNTVRGKVKADNVSMAFAIQSLKKFGVISFMRGNTLYSGLPYYDDQINEVNRQFNWNIIDDSLEQKNAIDTKVKLVVKCLDNKNLAPVEVGDAEGDTITYLVSGVTTQAQMRELGDKELPKYKFDGWKGSFTTFGDEFIKHGDVINLTDKVIKDRNGKYFVKKVNTKFGTSGFRNTIDLDKKYQ
jgi:hypothetical protein